MELKELREKYSYLMRADSIEASKEVLDIFLEYLFLVIRKHAKDKLSSQAEADAQMVNQMIFTKANSIKKILEGTEYKSKDGGVLNKIIDPIVVASMVRAVYETVCMFHIVYTKPATKQEHDLIYKLWVIGGLKYRQNFPVSQPKNVKKLEFEAKQIENLESQIESSELFKSLIETDQIKLKKQIKAKEYKIYFEDNKLKIAYWKDSWKLLGIRNDLFEGIYADLSLKSHPSYVSVFQFEQMFSKDTEAYKRIVCTNMKNCLALLSIFVADYIKLFPNILKTYNQLDTMNQLMLDCHNTLFRGTEFSINDSWKKLG
ncbi:MAG: hypothetical protein ABJE80_22860 [Reichenbachiella sp.]|uniref:hypothetical protein n=1 Tax=Reichenbachiella sp. TaxID=2184521 RepID=UPI003263875D